MKRKPELGSLLLVHWDESEARDLAAVLRKHGWTVSLWNQTLKLGDIKKTPPTAVVISLRRLPSHGREVADALWYTKWGRAIPIVFFDGASEKVVAIRQRFSAAHYTAWDGLPAVLSTIASGGGPTTKGRAS